MVKVTVGDTPCDECVHVMGIHEKGSSGPGGMTDGYCIECDGMWPCRTYHIAAGWGDTWQDCIDANWCEHVQDVMR